MTEEILTQNFPSRMRSLCFQERVVKSVMRYRSWYYKIVRSDSKSPDAMLYVLRRLWYGERHRFEYQVRGSVRYAESWRKPAKPFITKTSSYELRLDHRRVTALMTRGTK